MEYPLGYREVIPDQTLPEKWKEIILNTGKKRNLSDRRPPSKAFLSRNFIWNVENFLSTKRDDAMIPWSISILHNYESFIIHNDIF